MYFELFLPLNECKLHTYFGF